MKKLILLATILLPFIAIAQNQFTITGKMSAKHRPVIAYLVHPLGDKKALDSAIIKNGIFSFKGSISEPQSALLSIRYDGDDRSKMLKDVLFLYIDKANIILTSTDSIHSADITGSVINNQHHEFNASVKPFTQPINRISQELYKAAKVNPNVKKEAWYMAKVDSINKYQSQYKEFHTQFYLTHPDSYLAFTMFNSVVTAGQLPLKEAQKQFDNFSPALKASDLGKNTANILAILGKRQVGVKVMDFTQPDTNGRSFSLSSLRGKYVLLDFWASWCGPCRTENPNVVKAYNELKGKNFEIVSISLDNNRAAWLNAINKDGMPWLHVSDLKGWKNDVAILFNIQSIPQNFLINPEGTIIAINLRGEDLDKRLATYIK